MTHGYNFVLYQLGSIYVCEKQNQEDFQVMESVAFPATSRILRELYLLVGSVKPQMDPCRLLSTDSDYGNYR